ncbi:dicarboxylate/amino acid:cation symporter [Pseudomonas sp. LPB0260]|uniref:dicarboxylate/amino acid:cation symporter n=1 Tax=Pseudomonas sp. LPB0260 TaxID=2614442 RepID=UPI0015C2A622|nr:dicarboxylate/amino acid:cation symporter [Pseudomonas sp. LPB0260]QLC74679.1 dicarboxylate/amino acid:cation symporter [Pseudomonas sp. LPB0260]QLC77447.1 dicarboxylate/amino acid:cation symporter [Pseudomonas sp. LPB0260]
MTGIKLSFGLSTKIFLGFTLGVLFGLVAPEWGVAIKPIGDAFIRAIQMLIIPIVFFSVAAGIANMGDVGKLKRVGGKTLAVYTLMTVVAGITGLATAHLLQPGVGFVGSTSTAMAPVSEVPTLGQFFLGMIPSNIFDAMAKGSVIQVILIAVLVGVALVFLGEKAEGIKGLCNQASAVILKILDMIMAVSPYGVFALMAYSMGNYGLEIFDQVGQFILADYAGLLAVWVVTSMVVVAYTKVSYSYLLKKISKVWMVTLSTTSSAATLPMSMHVTREDFKVPGWITSFMLPLGATINLMGAAVYLSVLAVFAAGFYGVDLSVAQMVNVVAIGTLLAMAAPGIPGGGIVMGTLMLQLMGLPFELVGVIAGIYRVIDMGHTTLNVSGDVLGAMLVAKSEGLLGCDKQGIPVALQANDQAPVVLHEDPIQAS